MKEASGVMDQATWRPPPRHHHLIEELDLRLPFWQYAGLYGKDDYTMLLDSAQPDDGLGRYSFLAGEPSLVYRAKRRRGVAPGDGADIEIEPLRDADGQPLSNPRVIRRIAEPFETLRDLIAAHRVDYRQRPVPLLGGAIGYIGYEAGYFIEELPDRGVDDLAMPDIYLTFVDRILAHCHRTGKSYLSIVGRGDSAHSAERRAIASRDAMRRRIEAFEADPPGVVYDGPPRPSKKPSLATASEGHRTSFPVKPRVSPVLEQEDNNPSIDVKQHFDRSDYCRAVETAKEHIYAGDAFEICMTHRFESPLVGGDAWDLYGELRRVNPAPFACYLGFPEAQVVSSSPERFLSLDSRGMAESRPIKGTRPRGATPAEDERLYRDLRDSPKDRAENAMIVDLVRNDFGRVCRFHSIEVPQLMAVEGYATVWQMVSTVRGQLDDGLDAIDLLRAAFPGGSMTGAPKIEAMKIIDRLEPVKRGIYSGAIGYFDFAGPMDLNIVIRSFVVKQGVCYYNVGGAIVADSQPADEYDETLDKARALIDALSNLKKSHLNAAGPT